MSSSTEFDRLAAARYPFNGNRDHDIYQREMRRDYIAALWQCKTTPAYYIDNQLGRFSAHCEPWMSDDNKGWVKVSGKKRKVYSPRTPEYGDY